MYEKMFNFASNLRYKCLHIYMCAYVRRYVISKDEKVNITVLGERSFIT